MQLTGLFRRSGAAMGLVVLVPLLAVAATVAVTATSEPDEQTLATVSVIAPEGGSTAAVVTQAVDGFRSTITSDSVVKLAAQDSGVSLNAGHDLTAERIGTSNLVELRVTTNVGEDSAAAVRALVNRTNEALYSSSLTSLQSRVATAQQRYDQAIDERARETERTGLLLPIETYRAKASEVTQLRVALATGDSGVDRTAVELALNRSVKELKNIGESVNAFENLEDSVTRARSELGSANQDVDSVETRLHAANDDQSVTISDPTRQSLRTTVIRAAVAALVVGTAVGCLIVLVIGLVRRPRPTTQRDHSGDDGSGPDQQQAADGAHRDREAALT